MPSTLSAVPVERRRRLAATVGLFSVLFITVGVVSLTGTTPGVVRVFSAVSLTVAAVLGLVAWGISHSVKNDEDERRLDAVIDEAVAARGGADFTCGCGHEHDPDEMHVRPGQHDFAEDACAHDGSGTDCTHNCVSCVMRSLRPSPTQTRSQRMGAEPA
ncbi:MAG TPA: hypothetical protein VKQ07_04495 [Jatrophihabitantaceae bacterium]|nr:hypothetical protein [Jatrophihabitantaceae bacterium]